MINIKENSKKIIRYARELKKEKEEKELKIKERKERKKQKKQDKKLEIEENKVYATYPKQYRKNLEKINKKSENLSDGLSKWKLLKENFFIILNS